MTGHGLLRLTTGAVAAAAIAGTLGSLWLLGHGTVPDAVLPVAAVAGIAVAWFTGRERPAWPTAEPPPRWLLGVAVVVLAALTATLVHGALATPSRQWDGAVAWDLKTQVLAAAPTLEQPFFRDPKVFCHSRDYPLLQPLLLALGERWHLPARLAFPFAYVLLVTMVGLAARAAAVRGRFTVLLMVAAAVTPMWLSPGGGGFDSGYGDALLTTWLTAAALGASTANGTLLVSGLTLAILQKPEGLPYAALLLTAVWFHGSAPLLRATVATTAGAGTLALALQRDLQGFGAAAPVGLFAIAAVGAALVWLVDLALRRRSAGRRGRWLTFLLMLVPAAVLAAWLLGTGEGTLGAHFADGERPLQRLDRLPRIALAIGAWAFGRGPFGLLFVLVAVVAVARSRTGSGLRVPLLGTWLLLAMPVWCLPFLTSPLDDLDRHLRATLPRVMLHWTGIAWLWTAAQLATDPGPQRALGSRTANP